MHEYPQAAAFRPVTASLKAVRERQAGCLGSSQVSALPLCAEEKGKMTAVARS